MRADGIGLYVHIPICVRKCAYCDFTSVAECSFSERRKYFERLFSEIDSYKSEQIKLDTVFFGGGTPSLMTSDEISELVFHIKSSFRISPLAEITVEANPKTLTSEKLSLYKSLGINRISLGLQSIHENELKFLGRIHTYEDFLDSYRMAREAGFSNISIDLMYGIPEQTSDSFGQTLDCVIALFPEHVSVYGLILEEGTPLYGKREELPLPTEDEEADMYYVAVERLSKAGYSHYEISNYARRGFESRHNLKYWRAEEYIGVGVSAYSYYGGKRFGNTRCISRYIDAQSPIDECEALSTEDMAYERVMLALRLSEGLSLSEYKERFGSDFILTREDKINELSEQGYLNIRDGNIALTDKGFYVSNSIISELI